MEKDQAEKKPAAPAKEPVAKAKPKSDKPHHIKVTQMSLGQVEQALASANQNMGGLHSHYAQALLARKEYLSQTRSSPLGVNEIRGERKAA